MTDTNFPNPEPSFTERVRTTARETAKTGVEIGEIFGDVVDRLSDVVDNARRPGKPLDTVAKLTREAPLAALFIAFVVGMAFRGGDSRFRCRSGARGRSPSEPGTSICSACNHLGIPGSRSAGAVRAPE